MDPHQIPKSRHRFWLSALALSGAATGTLRALLRGEGPWALTWAGVTFVVVCLCFVRWRAVRRGRLAALAGALVAGPTIAGAAALALRAVDLPAGKILSASFFLSELGYSPCFFLSCAFAISWSLLGLSVRGPVARADHWSSPPLLVWALLFVREMAFFWEGGSHWLASQWSELFLVAAGTGLVSLVATLLAMLPTLLQDRRRTGVWSLELAALVPVVLVLIDWAVLSSTVSIFYLRQLEVPRL